MTVFRAGIPGALFKKGIVRSMTRQNFHNKVAVITGAASGIGCSLARECASRGISIVLADINRVRLFKLSDDLQSRGASIVAVVTDVSKPDQVEGLADAAYAAFGEVNMLFNNAGVLLSGLSWEYSSEDWDWILDINLKGVVNGLHSFLPRMLAQDTEGYVVNTSSQAGLVASPLMAPYAASKHAVIALTETLFFELALLGAKIHTSVLCPGAIATDIMLSDQGRVQESIVSNEELAEIKGFLANGVQTGMSPESVAKRVFESLLNKHFWIFTDEDFKNEFRKRADSVLRSSNPQTYYS